MIPIHAPIVPSATKTDPFQPIRQACYALKIQRVYNVFSEKGNNRQKLTKCHACRSWHWAYHNCPNLNIKQAVINHKTSKCHQDAKRNGYHKRKFTIGKRQNNNNTNNFMT